MRAVMKRLSFWISGAAARGRESGELWRPVIVAMIAVRMMQASGHEVVDMVAMRHGLVSTGRTVRM